MALLEVSGLIRYYGRARGLNDLLARRASGDRDVKAVDGVSFSVERGEMLALVGESGCGKTTTAQTVLRLLDPTSGSVAFDGEDITNFTQRRMRPLRKRMQVVYQDPYESLDPRYRVGQTIEEPLLIHGIGATAPDRRALVDQALMRVELSPPSRFLTRYPHELSGGQRQRVAIAAALVVSPELLVADEPVSMLDVSVRAGVMALLKRLCREDGMGILMITHDLPLAAHFADRIAVMYLGRIIEIGEAREVLRNPKHPYTQALSNVTPRRGQSGGGQLRILGGEPANAAAIPAGCRFHPRCPLAQPLCHETDPKLHDLVDTRPGHLAACLLVD